MKIEWEFNEQYDSHTAVVPISSHRDKTKVGGAYTIVIDRRPTYCDRGDWLIFVESEGESRLDFADGFPRFFFGTLEEVKKQMETWVSRRKECVELTTTTNAEVTTNEKTESNIKKVNAEDNRPGVE